MLLIISQSKRNARPIADTFRFMSILAYVATPHEALSEVSPMYRAALILNPSGLPDVIDYVKRLKSYKSDMPVFALTEGEPPSFYPDVFEGTFSNEIFTPSLAASIISYANQNHRAKIGDYRLAGFDASSDKVGVSYFYNEIKLTRTEAMILRYLIRSYPIPKASKDIVKYAFKASHAPEPTSIRTHISLMNKKFKSSLGKRMITFAPNQGYIIITPEYNIIAKK